MVLITEMHLLWHHCKKTPNTFGISCVCVQRRLCACTVQNSVCVLNVIEHLLCVYEGLTYPRLSEYPGQPYEQHDTPDIQHASHLQTQAHGQSACEASYDQY